MKIDANDPRWTAYALGELEDEKERAELESILLESVEMRRMVEEIRQAADLVNDSMKKESFAGLTEMQQERIKAQTLKRNAWFFSKPVWALTTAAAVFALSLSFWMYELKDGEKKLNSPDTQIADLREQSDTAGPGVTSNNKRQPEVKIPAQSVTVIGSVEETAEMAAAPAVSELEREKKVSELEGDADMPTNAVVSVIRTGDKETAAQPETFAFMEPKEVPVEEAEPPAGVMPSQDIAANLPIESNYTADLIQIMDESKKESDNETRYDSGVGAAGRVPGGTVNGIATNYLTAEPQRFVDIGRGQRPIPPQSRWPKEDRRIYPPDPKADFNTEGYAPILDNPFMEVLQNPLSTFSIDVDTASYSNVRRFLEQNQLPPKDAVRVEELVNYFDYDYRGPGREGPFAAHFEMTESPWNSEHRLLRIGLKAKEIKEGERPPANLVFLIDVSGSMGSPNKLPLVQDAMHMLIDRMSERDRIAIVTYAGSTHVALPSTQGDRKWDIHRAIDRLRSGGSTNGASGIQLAYETAARNFIKGGTSRVILATDGDFNVGITSHGDLARLIEEKADSNVFLSALGFGMGNYKDDTLELLADKGRGNYAYIDTINEAKKVLVEQINATLVGIAKDVKIQVEFNPGQVGAYRLIGYEDRIMPKEDFNNDEKKAGVIGAGHAVTVLYEIVPAGKSMPSSGVDPLKYQQPVENTEAASSSEVANVKIRYKEPEEEESRLMEFTVLDSGKKFDASSKDFKFAASVVGFGMVLRDSPYKGTTILEDVLDWAKEGLGDDRHGYRGEFIRLLHRAISIKK